MKNNNISIQFLGAAETVTGSKHLVKTPEKNILIDCGLFQGLKSLRLKNREPLPFAVETIDILILTHAHLDHCGYIPLLVKSGYKGKILMTPPTRDLAEIILRDSGKIQEEDAARANREGFSKHHPALPLYTEKDVERSLELFETHEPEQWITLSDNVQFLFRKNGHILGSAFVIMQCFGKTIVFSGDIGKEKNEIMYPPELVSKADYLIMEGTYGDRLHHPGSAKNELAAIINDSVHNKGNLLIPSFAVGRAQELMHLIMMLKKELQIPDVPVYLDTPMGAAATLVLYKYKTWHKLSEQSCNEIFKHIKIIEKLSETKKIIRQRGPKIIIAASGMLAGGRVLEYLKHYCDNKRNIILLVGYQAEGTRGRALKRGASEIKIHGRYYHVKASVKEITSLSAHADQYEMLKWMKNFNKKPQKIFLVHGEPHSLETFRVKIQDELKTEVIIPKLNDEFILN